eukprot:TRINITY_DN593_c0_g3_i3.p1 TRINITY_DN593_c0_g3~~TRINITY_DN593_c0_g3_i3.p1  ORF type:complete len:340 (-),score=80.37 TRINITY_DN593_c0_g3_i3:1577-2596(-)
MSESQKQDYPPKSREPERRNETDEEEESESDDGEDSAYQPAYYRKKSRRQTSSNAPRGRSRTRKNTTDKTRLTTSGTNILKDNSTEISITKGKILQQQLQKQTQSKQQQPEKRLFSFEEGNCVLPCLLCDFSVSVTSSFISTHPSASESSSTATTTTTTSTTTTSTTTTSAPPASPTVPHGSSATTPRSLNSNFQVLFEDLKFYETKRDQLLTHLLSEHSIVIADIDKLALLSRYLAHWKDKLRTVPLSEIACEIHGQQAAADPTRKYWLLSSILPEDKELREKLVQKRLSKVIEQQQLERESDHFRKQCLFLLDDYSRNKTRNPSTYVLSPLFQYWSC